jgi:hypothetical protein
MAQMMEHFADSRIALSRVTRAVSPQTIGWEDRKNDPLSLAATLTGRSGSIYHGIMVVCSVDVLS